MTKWEYHVETVYGGEFHPYLGGDNETTMSARLSNRLNAPGCDGWELVQASRLTYADRRFLSEGEHASTEVSYHCVFKRPQPSTTE